MNPQSLPANVKAREILANLKSGAPLNGTVRSRSTQGNTPIAWIAIQLGLEGERQIPIKDEPLLQPGQNVVVQCVPSPRQPERYIFQLATTH